MNITIEELYSVIIDCVQVGHMEAIKAYEPSQDYIRLSEVKRWLKMMKIDFKKFDTLVSIGMIRPTQRGESRNSPYFYSKAEIKEALLTANVSSLITKDKIRMIKFRE